MTLDEIQKEIYQNKVDKNFNVSNVDMEFCLLYGEVAECFESYNKKKETLGSELADVAIYTLGLAEILGFSLYDEITKKMAVNKERKYEKNEKGVLTKVKTKK